MASRDAVLLLHGLWMNRLAMVVLAHRLDLAGYSPTRIGYRSMSDPLEANVTRLARTVAAMDSPRVHLVGHSLGAVIVLRYLQRAPDASIGRTVLLGPPIAGCRAAQALQRFPGGEWLLGESAAIWNRPLDASLAPRFEVGVIAGTRSQGLSRLFTRLPVPNDGVVCLDETQLPAACDRLELSVSHSGMLLNQRVANATAAFLSRGKFS